ncbi:MAG: tyrosine-protein phosphatase [Sedimentisphaerales bacterium]
MSLTAAMDDIGNRFVDIHCHCLPGIDDGPATKAEALALCRALVDDGVTTAIATPHQLGRFSGCNEAAKIREQVSVFNEELKNSGIALTVMPGADVRVDERICELLEADKILTLADGGKYILLELPHDVFIDVEPLLADLACLGIQAVISHPERHPLLIKQRGILLKWQKLSAHLQVTSASLVGRFGLAAQKAAWNFLTSGWARLVASDSHDLETRQPCMRAAYESINSKLGENIAHLVCIENPLRLIKGQDIALPVDLADVTLSMSSRDGLNATIQSSS